MSFLTPWYLLGALALTVPVWVHLIRHERDKALPFASLMFFRRLPQRTVQRRRLKYLALLAARCALVLLIAMAFARPYFNRAEAPAALAPKARLVVALVDRSLSMQYGDRAERAGAAVRQVLGRMSPLDKAQIIAFDSDARVLNAPTADRGALLALIDTELKPGALPTSFAAPLRALERIAQASPQPVAAYVISDFQKTGWTPGSGSPNLPAGSTLELIAVDDTPRANWSLSELRAPRETFQNRYPRRLQVQVSGSNTAAAKKELLLTLNGREVARRSLDIPASGSATVVFDSFELPPGASRGELRLAPGDDLPQDDVRYFALMRREPYRVAYLSGSDSQRELLYLREALSSGEDPMFTIEARPLATAAGESLNGYGAIVLSNAATLPARLGTRLKEYVESGGGLMVLMGDRTEWGALARSLPGLLPATDGDKVYARRDGAQHVTLGEFRREHALFEPFAGGTAAGFQSAEFFGYFRLKAVNDSAVLARFSTGEPALLGATAGRGRVLLLASALDNVWSDLPLRAGFVPFVAQALRHVAGARETPAAYLAPATVALDAVTGARNAAGAVVLNPAGKRVEQDSSQPATHARLNDLGFYEIRHSKLTEYVAANSEPRESDLTPLGADDRQLLARTAAGAGGSADAAATPATARDKEQRQSLWWTLLVAACFIAAGESFLGNRYLRGRAREGAG